MYLSIADEEKKIVWIESLISTQGLLFLALIFEDHSYVVTDQSGKPIVYSPTEDTYSDFFENQSDFSAVAEKSSRILDESHLLEQALEWNHIKKTSEYLLDCWVGLPESRFAAYKNWRTPSGYLCGTYAATVLLAYYQDFREELSLSGKIRTKRAQNDGQLSCQLRKSIQPLGLPTIPLQVSNGISKFLKKTGNPLFARSTVLGSWQRATKRIRQGKPVMVGILKILGSTYGNHWVTAYAYYESASGERFYKVHDNWGDTQRVIPASWGNGTVSLP